jgi:hypothetical protein
VAEHECQLFLEQDVLALHLATVVLRGRCEEARRPRDGAAWRQIFCAMKPMYSSVLFVPNTSSWALDMASQAMISSSPSVTAINDRPSEQAAKAFTSPGVSSTTSGMPSTRARAASGNARVSSTRIDWALCRSQPRFSALIGS